MDQIDRVTTPGAYLVEFMPWLRAFRRFLAPFKKEAITLLTRHSSYLSPLLKQQYQKYAANIAKYPDSFARRYVESKETWNLTDREMVWVLASIYSGASGTTSTAMQSIILNMCLFPSGRKKYSER